MRTISIKTLFLGLLLVPTLAMAEEKSPLEGQPAVRHKLELREGRFELGLSTGISLNRMVRNALLVGVKLEYHLNDWLSVGADVGYGIGFDTGLSSEIAGAYESKPEWETMKKRFSDIQLAGDIRVAFTPFSGKFSLFSKLFLNYDLYGFAGLGLAMTKNSGDYSGDDDVNAANEGFRLGPAFGIGMHVFFLKFFSMGIELKDIMFVDNPTGGDLSRGLSEEEINRGVGTVLVNGDDQTFMSHWFVGLNFTFYLPSIPKISL